MLPDPSTPPQAKGWRALYWIGCAALTLAVVLYALCVGYTSMRATGKFTPDSATYIDAARNLAAGRGLSSSMVDYNRLGDDFDLPPVPMVQHAPLWPMVIAAASLTGVEAADAAIWLAALAAALALLAAYGIGHATGGPAAGFLAVGLLANLPALRESMSMALSESFGLAFLLITLWLLTYPPNDKPFPVGWALAAGCAAGLTFASRYALLPVAVAGACFLAGCANARRPRTLAAFAAPCMAIVGLVLGRNLLAAGRLGGPLGRRSGEGLLSAISSLSQLGIKPLIPENVTTLGVHLLLIVALTVGIGLAARNKRLVTTIRTALTENGRWVLLIWIATYAGFLIYSGSRIVFDELSARLLLPALAAVIVFYAAALATITRAKPWIALVIALALVLAALRPEWQAARQLGARGVQPGYVARQHSQSETLRWLAEHTGPSDLLVAVDGTELPLYLEPTDALVFLTRHPPENQPTYEAIRDYLRRHEREFDEILLVWPKRRDSATHPMGPLATDLAARRFDQYPGLTLRADLSDGIVLDIDLDDGPPEDR
jgi:dolichyl-phosphate-mannose-protein mannosyltransferase